jgi:hypothetical protein
LERLKARNLIICELHGFSGNKTPWIRINWDGFEQRMLAWEAKNDPNSDQFDLSGHTKCPDGTGSLTQEIESNTEITTQTSSENQKIP